MPRAKALPDPRVQPYTRSKGKRLTYVLTAWRDGGFDVHLQGVRILSGVGGRMATGMRDYPSNRKQGDAMRHAQVAVEGMMNDKGPVIAGATMKRETRTAEQIRDEVARLLNHDRKKPLPVPLPTRLSMLSDVFEDYGANWMLPEQGEWEFSRDEVRRAILAVKAKWDLEN